MKNILKSVVVMLAVVAVASQATLAAFTANATITGNTFSTGSADLRLLEDLAGPAEGDNLVTSKVGGTFTGIYPGWTEDYGVKLNNFGSVDLMTSVSGVYVSDTSNLRSAIFVEAYNWTDGGEVGVIEADEVSVDPIAPAMTLEQWRNTPIALGELDATVDDTRSIVLRFYTEESMGADNQNQTTVFNFVFNGTTDDAVQE